MARMVRGQPRNREGGLPAPLYWGLHGLLAIWFVVAGLRLIETTFWLPLALMALLDWAVTRERLVPHALAACLMLAVFALMFVNVLGDRAAAPQPALQTLVLGAGVALYRVVLWRLVFRRAPATVESPPVPTESRRDFNGIVAIPYRPGYFDAIAAWASFLWAQYGRGLVWFCVFVALHVFMAGSGYWDWSSWALRVGTGMLLLAALVGATPLLYRLLWAYKIRQLGIHELRLTDAGVAVHGPGLELCAPWSLYDRVLETRSYFLLTRSNGLFSFIPKRGVVVADALDRIRHALHSRIRPQATVVQASGSAAV